MIWDDELEQLAMRVADCFGDDSLSDAMRRALRDAHARSAPAGQRLTVFTAGSLERAFRRELRRLLVAH